VQFTTLLGSTDWPFVVVDAQELERLTASMRAEKAALSGAVAFGRDRDGSFLAFRANKVVSARGKTAKSFVSLLTSRLAKSAARRRLRTDPLEKEGAEPLSPAAAYVHANVPSALKDERARDIYRACVQSKSFVAEPMPDGRIQLRMDSFQGGRRRSFVDAATWALIEPHLPRR
jgi:hypothetical protein